MRKVVSTLVLASAVLFLRMNHTFAASIDGVHPYDKPGRISLTGSEHQNTGTWGYKALLDFERSPYRTTTHMLHPYFRSAPNTKFLARDIRRLHPFIVDQSWEQYKLGGWAF